nr:retrovirus-related Pol polyprotein from transposon TNT 1-94 [Tanacetum cinerariifolium]
MAAISNVPQLVDKKEGSYSAVVPCLKPGKINKWKKRMLCSLTRMEPYYIQCIKDGPSKPKIAEDDIMESFISCEIAKSTWTELVYKFEGPYDTKENKIMDLKLEYQTFRAKPSESLSQTYTCYKTLLNELTNDGVTLSKHKISVVFMISLPEKWLSFSQGLRNVNHTQTLDLADIYKSQGKPKVQKDNKAMYKKMKAKLALFEASLSTSQSSKPLSKNKGLVAETFNWDQEEVSDDAEETQVKVLMALIDDELSVGKNHAQNGELIDITIKRDNLLALKQAKLEAVTFQIQNTGLTKLNNALQDQLKEERNVNEKWLNSSNKASQCISEQIPNQKKKILGGEQLIESSSKNDVKGNPFIHAFWDYDY